MSPTVPAQDAAAEAQIRTIVAEQAAAWDAGDGVAYARDIAPDVSFTNLFGMVMYGAAAFAEHALLVAAVRADVDAHVLDDAEHRHVDLLEHLDALAGIGQRDGLRRGHDHGAAHRHALRQGELDVARARRHVHDEVVELPPARLREQLVQGGCHHGPSPGHGLALIDEEADRHGLHAVRLERLNQVVAEEWGRDLIGSWKCTGTPAGSRDEVQRNFWTETLAVEWQFKGADAWLKLDFTKGKYFTTGTLRPQATKDAYRVELETTDKKKLVYTGTLDKRDVTFLTMALIVAMLAWMGPTLVIRAQVLTMKERQFVFDFERGDGSNKMLLGGNNRWLCFWDSATGEACRPPLEIPGNFTARCLSPDGKRLAVCSYDYAAVFTLDPKQPLDQLKIKAETRDPPPAFMQVTVVIALAIAETMAEEVKGDSRHHDQLQRRRRNHLRPPWLQNAEGAGDKLLPLHHFDKFQQGPADPGVGDGFAQTAAGGENFLGKHFVPNRAVQRHHGRGRHPQRQPDFAAGTLGREREPRERPLQAVGGPSRRSVVEPRADDVVGFDLPHAVCSSLLGRVRSIASSAARVRWAAVVPRVTPVMVPRLICAKDSDAQSAARRTIFNLSIGNSLTPFKIHSIRCQWILIF